MKYFGYTLVFLIVTIVAMINLGFIMASILATIFVAFLAKIFQSATSANYKDDILEQMRLGLMYENGEGYPQSYSMAMECYAKAAKWGSANAQFKLGEMYAQGKGVESNLSLAFEWHEKAAEQGHADAQSEIGYQLRSGLGVPRNEEMGEYWLKNAVVSYRKAAELGDASAQYNLGVCLSTGRGLLQIDDEEAVHWYRKSAENGFPNAQFEMGRRNCNSQWGAVPNWIEGHKWYVLSERDKKMQERIERLNEIAQGLGTGDVYGSKYSEKHMTKTEIATAEVAAQEWLNTRRCPPDLRVKS